MNEYMIEKGFAYIKTINGGIKKMSINWVSSLDDICTQKRKNKIQGWVLSQKNV